MRFRQPEESDHAPVSTVGRPADEAYRHGRRSVRAITSPVNRESVGSHVRRGLEGDGVSVRPGYDGAGKDEVVFVEGILF